MKKNLLLIFCLLSLPCVFGQTVKVMKIEIANNVKDVKFEGVIEYPADYDGPELWGDVEIILNFWAPRVKMRIELYNNTTKFFKFYNHSPEDKFYVTFSYEGQEYNEECIISSLLPYVATFRQFDSGEFDLFWSSEIFTDDNYLEELIQILPSLKVIYRMTRGDEVKIIEAKPMAPTKGTLVLE